jgi:hypothetical protein
VEIRSIIAKCGIAHLSTKKLLQWGKVDVVFANATRPFIYNRVELESASQALLFFRSLLHPASCFTTSPASLVEYLQFGFLCDPSSLANEGCSGFFTELKKVLPLLVNLTWFGCSYSHDDSMALRRFSKYAPLFKSLKHLRFRSCDKERSDVSKVILL